MKKKFYHLWLFVKAAALHLNKNNPLRIAAAVSYYAIFSLAPLLLITIVIGGLLFTEDTISRELFSYLGTMTGDQSAQFIQSTIEASRISSGKLLAVVFSTFLLIFSSLKVADELEDALNEILGFAKERATGVWAAIQEKILAFGTVILFGIFITIFLVGQSLLISFVNVLPDALPATPLLLTIGGLVLQLAVSTVFLTLIYRFLPETKLPWQRLWLGAFITALLLVVGQYAISLYLGTAPVASSFGVAGSVIAIMVWAYYSSLIFLFGVSVTHVYSSTRGL